MLEKCFIGSIILYKKCRITFLYKIMEDIKALYNIKYSITHFTIKFQENSQLNIFKESAIRGIIGQILLKKFCIEDKDCKNCAFKDNCISNNFVGMKLKYKPSFLAEEYIPSYMIICDNEKTNFKAGEELNFSIVFLSQGIILIPEIIRAVISAGKILGLNKYKYTLKEVLNDRNDKLYFDNKLYMKNIKIRTVKDYIENRLEISDEITMIKIMRPFRFKKEGKLATDINEKDLINLLTKRILTLNALEGNKIDQLKEYNLKITDKEIAWEENSRYSNRQNMKMKLGGLIGYIYLETTDLETKKLLIAGELLHIGKNTSFGLGDYILY